MAHLTKLAVVGTDLKFIGPLLRRFDESGRFDVRVDEWPKFRVVQDEEQTREVIGWADTIVCEWAGPNAVVASRLKRNDQRLIVRLHRMELSHPYWRDIDIGAVDRVVTVGPYYRRQVVETTGWPEDKVVVVPNGVDTKMFDIPKEPGAIHHLGMIGAASSRKRLDLALDVLHGLRSADDRFCLYVKGSNPWGLKWVEDRPEEVEYFDRVRDRIGEDPLLGDAVTFDPPGADVHQWLAKIGFVLSTSDDESFHLSPAEGMASRSVPMIRPWPGADEIYDANWILDGPVAMAERILDFASDPGEWLFAGDRARNEIMAGYDVDDVAQTWMGIVETPPRGRALRVSVVSGRNPNNDWRIQALVNTLDAVGHSVTTVSRAAPSADIAPGVSQLRVETGPRRLSWPWIRRRLGLGSDDGRPENDQLLEALGKTNPEIVYPHRVEDISMADATGAPTMRAPGWPPANHDLITIAPRDPVLSSSPRTTDASLPTWPAYSPAAGRHEGVKGAIVYRVSPTSPGRYLEAALRRAGVELLVMDGVLDWDRIDPDCAFVVVVESPYPALEVRGGKPLVPTLFWVHHGEHHLPANVRLAYRYQADAVLLAHSWHLAHRYPVATHRFPFGFPSEMSTVVKSWPERRYDVAMVGAGIGGTGGRYDRRREIVDMIDADASLSAKMAYGLKPEEMISVYGDARIVLNDGGPRHFPITMRVFEAVGSGALLLTEDTPGTETILKRGEHYVRMEEDVATQARNLVETDEMSSIAAAGHHWVMSRHTYDHRVDLLLSLAGGIEPDRMVRSPFPAKTPMAALIDQDVDVQTVAVFGEADELTGRDRAVRPGNVDKLGEKTIDAVVIGKGAITDIEVAVAAARGYVYSSEEHASEVSTILERLRPDAVAVIDEGMLRADLGESAYRTRPADHPLSS